MPFRALIDMLSSGIRKPVGVMIYGTNLTEMEKVAREVQVALPELGRGWFYYGPTTRELRSCIARTPMRSAPVQAKPARECSQQERILGLCK